MFVCFFYRKTRRFTDSLMHTYEELKTTAYKIIRFKIQISHVCVFFFGGDYIKFVKITLSTSNVLERAKLLKNKLLNK